MYSSLPVKALFDLDVLIPFDMSVFHSYVLKYGEFQDFQLPLVEKSAADPMYRLTKACTALIQPCLNTLYDF
jgi:hypothetical protein